MINNKLFLSREEIKRIYEYSLKHSEGKLFLIRQEPIAGIGKGLSIAVSSSYDEKPTIGDKEETREDITDYSNW